VAPFPFCGGTLAGSELVLTGVVAVLRKLSRPMAL
jgi:hypothetical protein